MKKIATMVMVVITMIMSSSIAFAYNGDPTSYNYNYNYNYNNYNYNYNNYSNRYSGLRPNASNSLKSVPNWLEDIADEYGAEFYVNPNSQVSRLDVFFSIARMLESKFERDGITFSTASYAMFSDLQHLDYSCVPLATGLYNRGILRGYTDGTAKLPQSITRAEFTAVVNRLAHLTGKIGYGYNNYSYGRTFSDVQGHWAEQAINETVAAGMMSGVSYNEFDPDGLVTYAQMFKVLTTFVDDDFGLQKYDVAYGCTNTWDVDFDVEEEDTSYGKNKITSLTATESTIYVEVGETVMTKVKINPSDATNKTLSWEAQSERIVFIDDYYTKNNYGYVAVEGNKVGSTYIVGSATDGSKKSVKIKVVVTDGDNDYDDDKVYVTSIKVDPSELELTVGESKTVTATVKPVKATNKKLTWKSHNTSVAKVDQNGKITAVGVGNTTITVTAKDGSGIDASINVTVTADQVIIDDTTAPVVELTGADNVAIGEKVTLTVKVYEENLENFKITSKSLLGLTNGASISNINKVSDDTYEIVLMGVEVSALELCVDAGVAVDAAGNVSAESNPIVIYINSGEDL